ncbi:S-adenosyl-L-methionine-dependent tRNA 4-demethylwyosine synthase [Kappamyces sp. JEL0680]|nr:S-adenosyl-L-methionine-dependent tRNA 4-demethylwyosine synthase [Kappamyces sp. JEL0680]
MLPLIVCAIVAVSLLIYNHEKREKKPSESTTGVGAPEPVPAQETAPVPAPLATSTKCCQSAGPVSTTAGCCKDTQDACCTTRQDSGQNGPSFKIIYASQNGTSKKLATELNQLLASHPTQLLHIKDYEWEDLATEKSVVVFFLSTYMEGTPSDDASWFHAWLTEYKHDFRVGSSPLSTLSYAVFGLGNSEYKSHFCSWPLQVSRWLHDMGATRLAHGMGDQTDDFSAFTPFVDALVKASASTLSVASEPIVEQSDEEYSEDDAEDTESQDGLVDIEDVGNVLAKGTAQAQGPAKAMVTPKLRASLEKQRYKIVGSHSGVKVCRWTKSMLRGRGGCYKHSFYGIESHRCMETTPSLACANRCVFCWRSHTNPVGTEWKWQMDDAKTVVDGAMEGHYQMIKQLKGVPGVKEDRYKEAMQIRHCALSLVGEPIMYPQINEFVSLLHERRISSFLVTNAQFPKEIRELQPVTQLYVSIDAGTKDSLKKVDRPLFKDFWERYLECLDALKEKGQRTVYRLTLVKEFNTEEVQNYANLVLRGEPELIEVKGMTFCGFSGSQPLTMKNVPYHQDVVSFCKELAVAVGEKYELACVHEHSCSVLLAHKKFKINGEWHTWIDYEKFHDLVAAGVPFTTQDYMMKTPAWAVYGSQEQGFDPNETRWYRKGGKGKQTANVEE